MSDSQEKRENRFAEAISEIAHGPMGYFIGFGLMMFAVYIGIRWDGHLHDRKGCIQLQEVSGSIYKVDTCTGKTELLKSKDGKSELSGTSNK